MDSGCRGKAHGTYIAGALAVAVVVFYSSYYLILRDFERWIMDFGLAYTLRCLLL